MNEYLNDAKFIAISPDDYDHYQKLKADELKSNPAHLGDKDAPLNIEHHFYNEYEHRLLQFRYHLLQALKFEEKRGKWQIIDSNGYICPIENELIKTGTDTEFFDAIEATGVNVDFK